MRVLEALGYVGSFLGGIGVIAAVVALFLSKRQAEANERATLASVYQALTSLGNSINDLFVQQPQLFSAIFGPAADVSFATIEEEHLQNPQRFYAALKWLDYFESVSVLWSAIPRELHEPWRAYIRSHFKLSPYLRRIVLETSWYGSELRKLCHQAEDEERPKSTPGKDCASPREV